MIRLHCCLLALAIVIFGGGANPGRAESDVQQPLVESPFLYLANTVFLHHASTTDSVDFIHLVTPTAGADAGNGGTFASRFNAAGQRLIETRIDFGPTCGPATVCQPLRAVIASSTDYVVVATDGTANRILLSFVNRSTLANRQQTILIPADETMIDVAGNGIDALFVLTGAKATAWRSDLYGELRIRKYSLAGSQVGPTKSITSVLPWRSTQTTLLGRQPDAGTSMIVRSTAAGDTVFVRMQEAVVNVPPQAPVLETHLTFAKIDMAANTSAWAFRIASMNYPSTPATGASPIIKAWTLDGGGNVTIVGHIKGGDQPLSGRAADGRPFIDDVKGLIVWHLRADGTLDQYCAWKIPNFKGLALRDYTLSKIELQPFRDGTLITADAALAIDVDRGASQAIPMLPQTASVGVALVARLSSSGTLVWSDAVSRSDQQGRDPRCCELRPQDFWSLGNATADVISSSLIRVTAQSSRAPSYAAGFGGTFQLDGEQVAVDLNIVDTAPTSQFLAQQYLMGWRYSFINFIKVSDAPN